MRVLLDVSEGSGGHDDVDSDGNSSYNRGDHTNHNRHTCRCDVSMPHVSKGNFSKSGAQMAMAPYSADFEREADYVGLYIMARAGYNIDKAPDVWRMMSAANPEAIYVTSTHPNNPARTIAMTKTVAEIHAKQRSGQPLIPNIQKEA